ncbi:MAG: T9SS type A sorting domain-containing protein [Stygiobacter sp.]
MKHIIVTVILTVTILASKVFAQSHNSSSIVVKIFLLFSILWTNEITLAQCVSPFSDSLGTVVTVNDLCPNGPGSLPNTTCRLLEVRCPNLNPIQVQIRITEPNAGVVSRGTVVFGSGSSGTAFYGDRTEAQILFSELAAMGFRVVDRAWLGQDGWTTREGGLRSESRRYATLLTWIHDSVHVSGAFCATGNSGGSAEIGYALTTWKRGDILDLAVPTSGPAVSRLDYACQNPAPSEWSAISDTIIPPGSMSCKPPIILSPNHSVCQQCSDNPTLEQLRYDSVVHPDAVLHYPKTKVHFIYGMNDCAGPSVPIGLTWSSQVTSAKVIEFVPNTSHSIVTSTEGREAIRNAIDVGTRLTSVQEEQNEPLPTSFQLEQNFPNPFNPTTTIRFSLPHREHVTLKVYDVLGREVATLVDGELNAGKHSVAFFAGVGSAFSGDPKGIASGVYFYRFSAGAYVETKRMVVLK